MLSSGRHDHRHYIERLLIAVGIGVALLFIWTIRDALVLVFGAVVLATLLRAIADPIAQVLPVGGRGAVALTVLLVAAVVGAFIWLLGGQVRGEFAGLWRSLPGTLAAIEERLTGLPAGDRILTMMRDSDSGANVVARMGNLVLTLGGALADFILILFGAIFIAAQPGIYKTGLLKLLPRAGRALVADALDDSGRALKRWLLGQLVSMLIIGVLIWAGLRLIGLPAALALGVIAGATEIVPYVGPIVAAIPGLLLASLQGPDVMLWTLFVYLAVQQFEGIVIAPLVQRKAVSLPPALTIFGVIAAGLAFGFLGLIFAAPLLVVTFVMVKKLYVREVLDTSTPVPGEPSK